VNAIVVAFVRLPEVPVTVTVRVPVAAVLLAVSVNVLVEAAGFGLNDAMTPLGRPDADRLTLPLNPFCGVTMIMLMPLAPCETLRLLGDADREKFGGTVTLKLIVIEFIRLPEVPVMVSALVPVVAVLLAVSVNVLVEVVGFGLKEAVTPLGRPDADRLTLLLKPFRRVTAIVLVSLAPCMMLRLFGDAPRVKFPAGFTVRETTVPFVRLPEVPVMFTVTVPTAAVPLAVRVKVLEEFAGFGLKEAVTPLGKPDADRLTLPLKPLSGVTAIVLAPLAPCVMLALPGEAESVKFGVVDGQWFTRLAAFTLPIPVAKSQPKAAP